jgi:hypothetical protein
MERDLTNTCWRFGSGESYKILGKYKDLWQKYGLRDFAPDHRIGKWIYIWADGELDWGYFTNWDTKYVTQMSLSEWNLRRLK